MKDRLQLKQRLAVCSGAEDRDHDVVEQFFGLVAVVPAESSGEDRPVIALFEDEPLLLLNSCVGVVAPEIDAQQFLMSKPD